MSESDPTGWFEPLYVEAAAGHASLPWARDEPTTMLTDWTAGLSGDGRTALVVGAGLGQDAEHVASLGFRTTAFDIAPTAVASARKRHPDSVVDYVVADLLDPPAEWTGAFDLVIESITVQSMPTSVRATAIANVAQFVAAGGTLLVISAIRAEGEEIDGPPWPLTRSEIESFGVGGNIEAVPRPAGGVRWRATFRP